MPEIISSPNQLICEGKADEVFFRRLLTSVGKDVQVSCPRKDDVDGGTGKDAIHKRLIGLQAKFGELSRVIVVVDSDDNPTKAFNDACREFEKANQENPKRTYPIASQPAVLTKLYGAPSTAIVLVPASEVKGCLDTLLLASFKEKYGADAVKCCEIFCECIGARTRGETRQSKAFLRSLITASVHRNPGISLSFLLEPKNCPVSLTHSSFDAIRSVLIGLLP
jgi:hypothetical protein